MVQKVNIPEEKKEAGSSVFSNPVEISRKLDAFSKKLDTIGKEDLLKSTPDWLALAAAAHVMLSPNERKKAIDEINRKIEEASKRNGLDVEHVDLSEPIKKMYEAKARGDEDLKKEIHAFYEDVGKKYGGNITITEGEMFNYIKESALPLTFSIPSVPKADVGQISGEQQQKTDEDEKKKKEDEAKKEQPGAQQEQAPNVAVPKMQGQEQKEQIINVAKDKEVMKEQQDQTKLKEINEKHEARNKAWVLSSAGAVLAGAAALISGALLSNPLTAIAGGVVVGAGAISMAVSAISDHMFNKKTDKEKLEKTNIKAQKAAKKEEWKRMEKSKHEEDTRHMVWAAWFLALGIVIAWGSSFVFPPLALVGAGIFLVSFLTIPVIFVYERIQMLGDRISDWNEKKYGKIEEEAKELRKKEPLEGYG